MDSFRVKMAQLSSPVQIAGFSNRLLNAQCEIVWVYPTHLTVKERSKPNGPVRIVPIDTVTFMELLSDEDIRVENAPKTQPEIPAVKAKPVDDTVKYVKRGGEIVEEKRFDEIANAKTK